MLKGDKKFLEVSSRYILILLLGLGNLWIFYKIFTPLTANLSFLLLKLISPETMISGTNILFKQVSILLVPACVAGSAYYLLTILALSVADVKPLKRASILLFTLASFLILNVLRIFLFSNITEWSLFNTAHLIGWYLISTVFVVGIWFLTVKLFRIKSIPIYTDFKFLFSRTTLKKQRKKSVKQRKNTKRSKKN